MRSHCSPGDSIGECEFGDKIPAVLVLDRVDIKYGQDTRRHQPQAGLRQVFAGAYTMKMISSRYWLQVD